LRPSPWGRGPGPAGAPGAGFAVFRRAAGDLPWALMAFFGSAGYAPAAPNKGWPAGPVGGWTVWGSTGIAEKSSGPRPRAPPQGPLGPGAKKRSGPGWSRQASWPWGRRPAPNREERPRGRPSKAGRAHGEATLPGPLMGRKWAGPGKERSPPPCFRPGPINPGMDQAENLFLAEAGGAPAGPSGPLDGLGRKWAWPLAAPWAPCRGFFPQAFGPLGAGAPFGWNFPGPAGNKLRPLSPKPKKNQGLGWEGSHGNEGFRNFGPGLKDSQRAAPRPRHWTERGPGFLVRPARAAIRPAARPPRILGTGPAPEKSLENRHPRAGLACLPPPAQEARRMGPRCCVAGSGPGPWAGRPGPRGRWVLRQPGHRLLDGRGGVVRPLPGPRLFETRLGNGFFDRDRPGPPGPSGGPAPNPCHGLSTFRPL